MLREKEMATHSSILAGESHGQGLATIHAVAELDITEHTQAWLAKLVIYF